MNGMLQRLLSEFATRKRVYIMKVQYMSSLIWKMK